MIHIVEEDDPEHEPLEPGEWVEEPEEKPAPAPVLTVAQRGALPSLEDLIKPRQDLVPHQRVFPLPRPASPNQQRDARAEGDAEIRSTVCVCCQLSCLCLLSSVLLLYIGACAVYVRTSMGVVWMQRRVSCMSVG